MMNVLYKDMILLGMILVLGGCATATGPLATLPTQNPEAAQHNLAGIKEYNNGQWEDAKRNFELAIQADPNLPEVHFNLALALHKLDKHEEATQHFTRAGELAPDNKEIVDSSLYRNHLGISSTAEKHISGGYRY